MKNEKRIDEIFFLPLGGSGEIGMNFNMYGYKKQWLIIDCGVTFRDPETLGSEIFMPNLKTIMQENMKISGLFITHAHEDHIGAVQHLWPVLKCPIYTTPFSAHLLKQRLIDAGILDKVKLVVINKESKFSVGSFDLELINVNHSIVEPNAILIKCGNKKILHTGDWKLDDQPNIGNKTNIKKLKQIGKSGVHALVCDSTNANVEGVSGSENDLLKGFSKNIKNFPNRIFFTMFASNVERLNNIINLSKKLNREVGLIGRSMWRMFKAAKDTGYINLNTNVLSERNMKNVQKNKFLAICTGSQGEPLGALNRMADGIHPHINFFKGDRVIFSSRRIPGNEYSINNLINKLIEKEVEIILPREKDIHVSGHPAIEELKNMYSWIMPKIAIPIHGEASHIKSHYDLAKKIGVKDVVETNNGHCINIGGEKSNLVNKFFTGRVALNGEEIVPVDSSIFKERKKMLYNGVISVNFIVSETGDLQELPRIKMLAVYSEMDKKNLKDMSYYLHEQIKELIPLKMNKEDSTKEFLRKKLKKYISNNFYKTPSIIIDIIYLED